MANTVSDIIIKFKEQNATRVGAAFQRISREARALEKTSKRVGDVGIKFLRKELESLRKSNVNSISSMKAQKNALLALRDMADVTGNEFRQLTAEINRVDKALSKTAQNKGAKGAIGGVAKTFGAIAGAGIYGGLEGLAGSAIGGLFGGPGGAIAGGVIGAQIGMARQGLKEIAVYNASLGRQRKALQLVIGDTNKYKKAQQFLADTSERLAIPQDVITRQFTSLTASVVGAGHSVQDAQDVFLSITSGIRGTGGSIEDMNAALRATSQVFSKGKVSAEELRQQLGERLPGAFTLFAASMNKTPAELDKALEQGKVTLQDFMGFSKHLFAEYGENAAILSKAPEAAGDRLAVEIAKLKVTFGGLFTNIGAAFQDNTTKILKFLNENQQAIKLFVVDIANFADKTVKIFVILADAFKNFVVNVFKNFGDEIKFVFSTQIMMINLYIKALNAFRKLIGKSAVESLDFAKDIQAILEADPRFTEDNLFTTGTDFQALIDKLNKQKKDAESGGEEGGSKTSNLPNATTPPDQKTIDQYLYTLGEITKEELEARNLKRESFKIMEGLKAAGIDFTLTQDQIIKKLKESADATVNFKDKFKELYDSVTDLNTNITNLAVQGIDKLGDAFADFVVTGKASFKELAASILADLGRMIAKALFFKAISNFLPPSIKNFLNLEKGGVVKKSATGNVFAKNKIVPYAKGGILSNSIVDKPTIFPMAKGGIGLMAEAGYPEAVMPLKRGRDGKLGVISQGGGVNNVTVNVDASGSSVEGDSGQAEQLGAAISQAIQAELLEQKKPGGLLYN